jgi:hypothetical protein
MKLYIKVSRDAAKSIKTLSDDLREYIGATLNSLVSNECLGWEDVATLSADNLMELVLTDNGCDTLGELETKAESFCWSCGYLGYKLQSRF